MTRFETSVEIARGREEVFDYVADPGRFAEWNSAVESVAPPAGAGATTEARYVMRRLLPAGPATNELVLAPRPPDELTIRTISGPTPFVYRYGFEPTEGGTVITLRAEVWLGAAASVLGPLAARAVKRGVDANFAALREILERAA